MKKFVSLLLAFSLALCLAACGGSASSAVSGSAASSEAASSEAASSEAAQELSTTDALRIAGLKGPTTMGLVNLLSMEADGTAAMDYDLQLYGAADEIVPLLMKGELDMAAIPANLAATLYQKTNGGIQAVAVNTLGVLYVVEQGDTVQSMADLKGRTILSTGKGTTPEYVLRYLLNANGIDPDKDVTTFLTDYARSVEAANTDLDGTAALCEEQGVVAKAAIAKKALPNCNIVCLTGDELKADASAYLQVLFDADPAAVGGALPGDDFYWTAE